MGDKVSEIKKARGCAVIWLESGEKLRVPAPLLRERMLRPGESVNVEEYTAFIARRAYPHALDKAVKMLSLRDHSQSEISRALLDAGYPESAVRRVLEKLIGEELLDDAAFAARWAESRARKHGRARIASELNRRGVDKALTQAAVEQISDEEQLQNAVRLTGKFLARTHGAFDRALYQRTLSMLARHGYDLDIAKRAIRAVAEGRDTPSEDPE